MTEFPSRSVPQFYLTAPAQCAYLPDRKERKVFTHLLGENGEAINNALSTAGFRRSQHVAYRPACDGCNACVSVRVDAESHKPSRSERRLLNANADLSRTIVPAKATSEQFSLMRDYLDTRHAEGGMSMMTALEFAAMVEETPVKTRIVEYRLNDEAKTLIGAALTDWLADGLSMVYSFFAPSAATRGLGNFMILDHIALARELDLPRLYLGYWVAGSEKMDYKKRFKPLEYLGPQGWRPFEQMGTSEFGAEAQGDL